jgi:hypothetical protein
MNQILFNPARAMFVSRSAVKHSKPEPLFAGGKSVKTDSPYNDAWIDRNVTRPTREALVFLDKRQTKKAVGTSARAMEMAELIEGENVHRARAESVRGLTLMRMSELQKKPESKQTLGRAADLLRRANGFYDSDITGTKVSQARVVEPLQCKIWLAQACTLQGSLPMAGAYLVEADHYAQRKGLEEHPLTAMANRELGINLHDRGDLKGAEAAFIRSIRLYDKLPRTPETAEACNTYADLLEDTGNRNKAQKLRQVAQTIMLQTIDSIHQRFYE